MKDPSNHVYDLETLQNLFIAHFEDYKDSNITKTFIVHDLRNDINDFIDFLEYSKDSGEYYIGFNNISFDSQVIEFILKNRTELAWSTPREITEAIYNEAQAVIDSQNFTQQGSFRNISEWNLSIKQIDLFKLNHFDNQARRSSLKWVQYTMDWHSMEEMPIDHKTIITTQEEIDIVLSYCINDVKSTKELYNRSKSLLDVRLKVQDKYKLDCLSYSNTKMGSELLLKLYCEKTGLKRWDVKKLGTHRDQIKIKDILFPYIKFKSLDFIGFHEMLKTKVITETKNGFKYTVKFKGYKFDFAQGGLHMNIGSGIYRVDDEYIIKDLDVSSLYPSLACVNNMYPAHLGKEFFEVYKNDIVDVRLAEKAKGKDGDKAIINGYKEASNASYGLSNSKYSWLYDSQFTMQICINGQLLLSMLAEELLLSLSNCQLLQINTDGLTLKLKKTDIDKYYSICKNWESITNLKLEFAEYSSMFLRDVNNYISVYTNGKYKLKGAFEFENLPLYKNKSFLIIPKAIYNYFVNNILPEQYLKTNRNIFDYCGGVKATGDWKFQEIKVIKGEVKQRMLSKVVRYYISNKGAKIIKHNYKDGRDIQIEAGECLMTEFNKYIEKPWNEYNIDDSYYLDKIYKEIANISPPVSDQYKLEF